MDDNEDVKVNEEYYTKGILEGGIDGVFRHNDKLFNEVKSGTWSQTFNTPNIDYKVGAIDGNRYVQYYGLSTKNMGLITHSLLVLPI